MFDPASPYPVLAAPFVGSFLGVLITRLPRRQPVILGRSVCTACGHPLAWRDLVPLASWLLLRGHCRYCNGRIGPFYPAIELAALAPAIWAAAVAADPLLLWVTSGLGWCLLSLAIIDAQHEVLPDALTLPLILAGLAVAALLDPAAWPAHLVGCLAGNFAFVSIGWLYRRIRKREGLGRGDAKLLAAAGAWTSWEGLPSVVLIAAVIGLASALAMRGRNRELALDSRIPFGPGLCLGLWLVWLYGPLG
jgi:leader peptidase (prepilin peptidase)/N-methyltransferase